MTPHEVKLWNWIRECLLPLGYHFRRQVPIERFVVDFACLKQRLVVEVDGEQHGRDPAIQAGDRERDARLTKLGYRVLRFTNFDVDRQKAVVLDTILSALDGRLSPDDADRRATGSVSVRAVSSDEVARSAVTPKRLGLWPSPPSPAGEGSTRPESGAD